MERVVRLMSRARVPLLAVALTAGAIPALAQDRTGSVEISPFAGGSFGGTLHAGTNAIFSHSVDVGDTGAYGIRIGVNANRWFGVEASFSYAKPDLQAPGGSLLFGQNMKLGDLEQQNYDLNAVFNMGRRRIIPYLTLGLGATRMKATVPGVASEADTRFATNFGLGLKAFMTPNVGLRFDGRIRATYINNTNCDAGTSYCTDPYYDGHGSRWYTNGEVTGGLTFAF